jgi:very-short-patch-repair endonuclease
MLWDALRDRRLDGVRVKRQQPIDRYVVDFFAPGTRLVVEIDGSVHDGREETDALRQAILEGLGVRFVRLRSEDVERDLESALERIRRALPSPALRGRGAGGEASRDDAGTDPPRHPRPE